MAAQGRNKGFHVLDEFVGEAIHAPSVPLANPASQGKNEGMSVVEELVFEADLEATRDETPDSDRHLAAPPEGPDPALKSAIGPLAAYISASSNPRGAFAHAMELLRAELTDMDRETAKILENLHHADPTSEMGGNQPRTEKESS